MSFCTLRQHQSKLLKKTSKKLTKMVKKLLKKSSIVDGNTNDRTLHRMWVPEGIMPSTREVKNVFNTSRFMVWAAVGVGFKSDIIVLPQKDNQGMSWSVTGDRYVRSCLSKVVDRLRAEKRIFQQDGARCHVKKTTMKYLHSKKVIVLEDWAPYSPDLNAIETVWSLLHRRIAAKHPDNETELKKAILDAWASITQAEIDKICIGNEKKLAAVAGKNGAS